MALDHAAMFAGVGIMAESYDGRLPILESWPHVLIGLLTNPASGIFFFLAGMSVFLFENSRRQKRWSEWQISRFLMTRAAILILIELGLTLCLWGGKFSIEVLSALAVNLFILAFVRRLPLKVIVALALGAFLGYPLIIQVVNPPAGTAVDQLFTMLFLHQAAGSIRVGVPLLGRLSLVLAGYAAGRWLANRRSQAHDGDKLPALAAALFAVWLLVRLTGGYGNFLPYNPDLPPIFLFIENKQPPSIAFLLMNGALAVVLLIVLRRAQPLLKWLHISTVLNVFGQSALFFYVVHLLIARALFPVVFPPTFLSGLGLVRLLIAFPVLLLIMLPLSFAYRELRHAHPNSILRYF